MQKFLTIISAINDESRVLILYHLLRYKELCVCDLQELLNMGQSRLSRHLKILKDAGFLYVRRQGTWVYYGINNELLKLHLDLFENIKNLELKNVIKKNENIITQICP
ncbi:TPA: ArsR/SmtB family transcription factor [Campylobacter jejuni]